MALKGVSVLCVVLLLASVYGVRGLRVAEQKCQEYLKTIASLDPVKVDRTNEFVTKANGVQAQTGEFPHQVLVGHWFYEDDDDNVAFILRCSGALISDRYVLLPAHCHWAMAGEFASLGRVDYKLNSSLPEVTVKRSDIIFHPDFNSKTKNSSYDDIALVRLEYPVNFTSHVYPACLWTDEAPLALDKFTATAFTMGTPVNDTEDTRLVKLLMDVVPTEACAKEYVNSTYYRHGITEEQFCVESPVEWKSPCEGDVGGLLQTLVKGSTTAYRLYGVEGSGHACDENRLKLVYSKVQSYLDWIEQVVWGA